MGALKNEKRAVNKIGERLKKKKRRAVKKKRRAVKKGREKMFFLCAWLVI